MVGLDAGARVKVLAIVGSTKLAGNCEATALIEALLDRLQPEKVISGGAIGIDQMAALAARQRGIPVEEFLPAVANWEQGFKPRNLKIAQACTYLVRIASRHSRTYGSGWTRDRARERGVPCEEFLL